MGRPQATIFSAAVAAALLLTAVPSRAESVVTDLTPKMEQAGVNVEGLRAVEVGGIVVLRGKAADRASAERAGLIAQNLGYARVANLIQVIEPPDDAAIQRTAERKLAQHRSLDGCKFHVESQGGVLRVAGRVQHELQKDVAMRALRNIEGVRTLEADLQN